LERVLTPCAGIDAHKKELSVCVEWRGADGKIEREVRESLDGDVLQTGQHAGQVVAGGDLHPAAALDDGQNGRYLRSGLRAAEVDPASN
jgi:hypothetical protein